MIPVVDFYFPFFFITDPVSLLSLPAVSNPASLALILHSCQISLHAVLPSQSRSSSSPSTLHSKLSTSALFINRSSSILSTCPAHFSQLLTSFLVRLPHQLPPSAPPFFPCLFFLLFNILANLQFLLLFFCHCHGL